MIGLTGKAKELFRKWWATQPKSHIDETHCYLVYGNSVMVRLDSIPMMFQWGIYQEWAASMNIHLTTELSRERDHHLGIITSKNWDNGTTWSSDGIFETITEAREAVIERLNEFINNDPRGFR